MAILSDNWSLHNVAMYLSCPLYEVMYQEHTALANIVITFTFIPTYMVATKVLFQIKFLIARISKRIM